MERVLDDIEQSGLSALELGPVGYLPEDAATLRAALAARSLTAVGSFIFDDLHDPARRSEVLDIARRACAMVAAAAGELFVIIDRPDAIRVATAGRPSAAPRLAADGWRAMLDSIEAVANVARDAGLRPVVHPHAGGYLEFGDEIDRFVQDTTLDLCLDTGHLAYARMDPVEAIDRYADRVGYMHFKDIRPTILAEVDAEALDFWTAIKRGIFCPIGEGIVDIGAVLDALDRIGYRDFITIEQDRVPDTGNPLDDVRSSMAVIEASAQRSGVTAPTHAQDGHPRVCLDPSRVDQRHLPEHVEGDQGTLAHDRRMQVVGVVVDRVARAHGAEVIVPAPAPLRLAAQC